jgi:hypothetical protein
MVTPSDWTNERSDDRQCTVIDELLEAAACRD